MILTDIELKNFRIIESAQLSGLESVNLITGSNGSGKTSLLEAIHVLGHGRSFRTRKWQRLVRYETSAFRVIGKGSSTRGEIRLGVERKLMESSPLVRLNGETLKATSELASVLPIQILDSAGFSLLAGPPEFRRQLLDWAVFHVEPSRFLTAWRRYQKALKHRNALLRSSGVNARALAPWTEELATQGELIHSLRMNQLDKLLPLLLEMHSALNSDVAVPVDVKLAYYPGWNRDESDLQTKLNKEIDRDIELGYTRDGPHRADLRVKSAGQPVAEVFSRGQLKSLVAAFRLSQAKLLRQYGIKSVFLIDDLAAELDAERRGRFIGELLKLDCQSFFTAINEADLSSCFGSATIKRFHVEHGRVTPLP
ncbi:DNA replication and repair protein RecF [Litorivivens lipolytica]|uniref:DNA replication and repair protein RecF n=1 Tax=Litorivivens lipolytica TaxID=1524264 RepID=A0A7W4W877_9GAMM|nr:DNA replication/repair protein RecF [Litorivivens lipolytica]MBB3048674.1 DNA replication and repair protein RecF [Litorivivens lipolytica]